MTAVAVRTADPADAGAIAAVHLRSWRAAYADDAPPGWLDAQTLEGRTAAWEARLDGTDPRSRTLVAADDDAVVGFCGMSRPSGDADADEDTAEIASFYVDPGRFRGGVGRALMDAALGDLAAGGYETVTLWVLVTNDRARAFYAGRGFADDGGRLEQAEWPTQIRMRRDVMRTSAR